MNPSAREVLEAERKLCGRWNNSHRIVLCTEVACPEHAGVLHGIELAERADLERVVKIIRDEKAAWGGTIKFRKEHGALDEALEAIRAAFPEVKEGE